MNKEEIVKIIARDMGSSGEIARGMAESITNLHDDLQPAIAAYLAGEPVSFAFGDITLEYIMEKENCPLVEAFFSMHMILENPETSEEYKSLKFRKGCLGE